MPFSGHGAQDAGSPQGTSGVVLIRTDSAFQGERKPGCSRLPKNRGRDGDLVLEKWLERGPQTCILVPVLRPQLHSFIFLSSSFPSVKMEMLLSLASAWPIR